MNSEINKTKISWITLLRWIAIIFQVCLIPLALRFGYLEKDKISLYILIPFFLILFNFSFIWKRFKFYQSISLHTIVDLIGFVLLILLTGKLENPFWPLIYLHAGMSAVLIEPKKDYQFLPFLFGSIAIVQAMSFEYYSSIIFILLPQWLIIIAIWFLTRYLGGILLKQQEMIYQLSEKEQKYQKLKSIGLLSSGILHEIGTPLNTIRLKINRLHQKLEHSAYENDIDVMDISLKSIEDVVSKLNQAQFEAENKILEYIDLNSFLTSFISLFKKEFNSLNIHFKTNTSYNVLISLTHFSLVLRSLFINSIEANAKNINIELKPIENFIQISFQDDGEGFSDYIIENFMAPYTSTKGKGRGIGLFNANLSIEAMGGKLKIENNTGALVKILLEKEQDE